MIVPFASDIAGYLVFAAGTYLQLSKRITGTRYVSHVVMSARSIKLLLRFA